MLLSSSLEQLWGSSILLSNRCHMFFVYRKICRSFKLTIYLRLVTVSRYCGELHSHRLYTIVNFCLGTGIALHVTLKWFLLPVIPYSIKLYIRNFSCIQSVSLRKLIFWPRYCHSVFFKVCEPSVQLFTLLGCGKEVPVSQVWLLT